MSVSHRDVQDILQEYIEHHHGLSHDIAYHLVKAAEACATEVAIRADLFPRDASVDFPEVISLAQFYSQIDPLRKTIFDDNKSGRIYDEIKFRHFYQWLDDKANSDEYGNGRKISLRDALVGTDAYDRAFPSTVPAPALTTVDDDYVDEDRSPSDYAEEYVRDA
tara:strand:- start:553 stop:1044 length:492 start_codon:yes stop_codon:yes gene_type:complete